MNRMLLPELDSAFTGTQCMPSCPEHETQPVDRSMFRGCSYCVIPFEEAQKEPSKLKCLLFADQAFPTESYLLVLVQECFTCTACSGCVPSPSSNPPGDACSDARTAGELELPSTTQLPRSQLIRSEERGLHSGHITLALHIASWKIKTWNSSMTCKRHDTRSRRRFETSGGNLS